MAADTLSVVITWYTLSRERTTNVISDSISLSEVLLRDGRWFLRPTVSRF